MPVTKSAIRKLRSDKKKAEANARIKKELRLVVGNFRKKPNQKALVEVYRRADRAAKKGVIHKNKVARLKSGLAKLMKRKRG